MVTRDADLQEQSLVLGQPPPSAFDWPSRRSIRQFSRTACAVSGVVGFKVNCATEILIKKAPTMRIHLKSIMLALSAAIAGLFVATSAMSQPALTLPARAFGPSSPIAGHYIVVFKSRVSDVPKQAQALAKAHGGRVGHVYSHAIKGFSAWLPDAAVSALRANPNVDYVEQDQTVSLQETAQPVSETLDSTGWGIDRIDQVTRPLNFIYSYNYLGAGVTAYIIDTGTYAGHSEFAGRVQPGHNVAPDANGVINSSNTSDCNGHGTHVAGTVGGTVFGVAKGVSLVPVRVLDCAGSGTSSGVVAGVDWVAASTARPAVANMSLGMSAVSTAVNSAVAGAVRNGVTMVVAAGNSNTDACRTSPASEPSAITVGATDRNDVRASYSNYGSCLDLFAPGSSITSAWYTGPTALATLNGTSMASPHVAGVAALALAANPAATPADVAAFVRNTASANQLSSIGRGSANLLVYSLGAGAPVTVPVLTVAVKSMTGTATKSKRNWTAAATVSIRDVATGAAVGNATVVASFTPGGSKSCLTGSTGSCKLSVSLPLTTLSTTVTVTNVTGTNMKYDAGQNTNTQITVARP